MIKNNEDSPITRIIGHAHAASGLLHVAAATLACYEKLLLSAASKPLPWLSTHTRTANVHIASLNGKEASIAVQEHHAQQSRNSFLLQSKPTLFVYSGADKQAVLAALTSNTCCQEGAAKLVLVAHDSRRIIETTSTAKHFLTQKLTTPLPNGIYFHEQPLAGDIGFVFTGALTTYPKMGWKLLTLWPQLLDEMTQEITSLSDITDCLYQLQEKTAPLNMFEE